MAGFIPAVRQALPALRGNATQEVFKIILIEELVELVSPTPTPAAVLPPATPVLPSANLEAPVEDAPPFGLGLLILLVLVIILSLLCCCCCRCIWSNWPQKGPRRPVRIESAVEELGSSDDTSSDIAPSTESPKNAGSDDSLDSSRPVSNESSPSRPAKKESASNNFAIDLYESPASEADSQVKEEEAAAVSDVVLREAEVEQQSSDDEMSEEQKSEVMAKLLRQIHGDRPDEKAENAPVDSQVAPLSFVRRDRERRRPVRRVLSDLPPVEPISDGTGAVALSNPESALVEDSHVETGTVETADSEAEHVETQSMPTPPVETLALPASPVENRSASPAPVRAASPKSAPVEATSPEPKPVQIASPSPSPVEEPAPEIEPVEEAAEEQSPVAPLNDESPVVSNDNDSYDMTAAELRAKEQSEYSRRLRARLERRGKSRTVRFAEVVEEIVHPVAECTIVPQEDTESLNNLPENHDGWNSFEGQQQTYTPSADHEEPMQDAEPLPEVEEIEVDPVPYHNVSEQQVFTETPPNDETMADAETETIEANDGDLMGVQHDLLESQEQPYFSEQYVPQFESIEEPMNDAAGPASSEPLAEPFGATFAPETTFEPGFELSEAEMTMINTALNAETLTSIPPEDATSAVQQTTIPALQSTNQPPPYEPWFAGLGQVWFETIEDPYATTVLNNDLPHRRTIATSAVEYECGYFALAQSLLAQYPDLVAASLQAQYGPVIDLQYTIELLTSQLRSVFLDQNIYLRELEYLTLTDANNLNVDALARILMGWAYFHGGQPLVLGYVAQGAEARILGLANLPAWMADARVLWIQNDARERQSGGAVGHWTGLEPAPAPVMTPLVTTTPSIGNNLYTGTPWSFTNVASGNLPTIAGQTGTDPATEPSAPVQSGNVSGLPPIPIQDALAQAPWQEAYPALAPASEPVSQNLVDQPSGSEALVPPPFDFQPQASIPASQASLSAPAFDATNIDPALLGSVPPAALVPQSSVPQPSVPVSFDFGESQQPPVFTGAVQPTQTSSSSAPKRKAEASVGELSKETAEVQTAPEPSQAPTIGESETSEAVESSESSNRLTSEELALMQTFTPDLMHRIIGCTSLATKKNLIAIYSSEKFKASRAANKDNPYASHSKDQRKSQGGAQLRPASAFAQAPLKDHAKKAKDLWEQIAADHERKKRENEMNDAIQRSDDEDADGEIDEDYYQHESSGSDSEAP